MIFYEVPEFEHYNLEEVSYIGEPKNNSVMYVTNKVAHLVEKLRKVTGCLVFAESGIELDNAVAMLNDIVYSRNPKSEYVKFVSRILRKREENESTFKYTIHDGYYIGKNVKVGKNVIIEPGCVIGHGSVIGNGCLLCCGSKIKNAVLGENVLVNEDAKIGMNGFTMTKNEDGDLIRIPSLGKVIIGDNVEIGVADNISCGSAGNTRIDDNVKLDALVHIGHDVHLHKNVEITAGVIVGGFTEVGESSFIGINAVVRNRIKIGKNVTIGMGAVVTKDIDDGKTVYGNPAK